MPWVNETWVDDDGSETVGTPFDAAHMNNIEAGIGQVIDSIVNFGLGIITLDESEPAATERPDEFKSYLWLSFTGDEPGNAIDDDFLIRIEPGPDVFGVFIRVEGMWVLLFEGSEGPPGPEGPKGEKGDAGSPGATGEKGAKGDTGATGSTGPEGPEGPEGPPGADGEDGTDGAEGPKGEKGDKGDTGSTGATGPEGAKGAKGDTGAAGETGAKGEKGDKGDTGSTGPEGPKGSTGSTGPEGPKGSTGETGAKGEKGDTGATGATGAKGENAVARTNNMTQPNFENGLAGCWIPYTIGSSAIEVTSADKKFGTKSLLVKPAAEGGGTQTSLGSNLPATPSKDNTLSLWVKGPVGKKIRFLFRELDGSNATVGTSEVQPTFTGEWQQISQTRTFGATGVRYQVFLIEIGATVFEFNIDGILEEQSSVVGSFFPELEQLEKEEAVWAGNAYESIVTLYPAPRGIKGEKGATGSTGPEGAKGSTGATGATGATDWTPVTDSSIKQLSSNSFEKVTNVEGDATLRSVEGFDRACYVEFTPATTNKGFGFGLNTDPATDENFTGIDYFLNCTAGGTILMRENGTEVGGGGSYSAGDKLAITYDGHTVRYWQNGTLLREVARPIGSALYLDSWWNAEGGKAENVHFGPMGEAGEYPGLRYIYDTNTEAKDPGKKKLKFNNATISSATKLYINRANADEVLNKAFINTWDDSTTTAHRGYLVFKKIGAPQNFAIFDVTAALVEKESEWLEVTISNITSQGTLVNGDLMSVEFVRTGDKGETGSTGSTGPEGPKGSTGSTGPEGPAGVSPRTMHLSVYVATVEALPANTRTGSKLEANANGELTIDGVALEIGRLILIKNELGESKKHGVYKVVKIGGAAEKWVLERAPEFSEAAQVASMMLFVDSEFGTVNAKRSFYATFPSNYVLNEGGVIFEVKPKEWGKVTAFPANPVVGDTVSFKAGEKVYWHFIYTLEDGTRPWNFIGGPPLVAESSFERAIAKTAYTALPTDPLKITMPALSADYDIKIEAFLNNKAAGRSAFLSYAVGATTASDAWAIEVADSAGVIQVSNSLTTRQIAVAKEAVIEEKAKSSAESEVTFNRRRLTVTPVRAG